MEILFSLFFFKAMDRICLQKTWQWSREKSQPSAAKSIRVTTPWFSFWIPTGRPFISETSGVSFYLRSVRWQLFLPTYCLDKEIAKASFSKFNVRCLKFSQFFRGKKRHAIIIFLLNRNLEWSLLKVKQSYFAIGIDCSNSRWIAIESQILCWHKQLK